MNRVCPLCKGAKVIPKNNGVQGDEKLPCIVCGGLGEVDEEKKPDSPIIIYKYHGAWGSV